MKDKQVKEGNIKTMTSNLEKQVIWPLWHSLGTVMLYMAVLAVLKISKWQTNLSKI